MANLIERDALMARAREIGGCGTCMNHFEIRCRACVVADILAAVEEAPPAGPVTCGSCNFGRRTRAVSGRPTILCLYEEDRFPVYHPPEWFCAAAEKREEEATA